MFKIITQRIFQFCDVFSSWRPRPRSSPSCIRTNHWERVRWRGRGNLRCSPGAGCRQTLNMERLDKIWIRMFSRYFPNCSSVPLTTKSAAFILSNVISGEVVGSVLWTWDHLKTHEDVKYKYLVWTYVETIRMFGAWRQAVRAKSIYVHGIWEDGLHVHVINNGGGALANIQMIKCV